MGNENRMPEGTIVLYIDKNGERKNKFKNNFNILKNKQDFDNVNDAIKYLKTLKFEEVKIFVMDKLYKRFLLEFKDNAKNICVIPNIYILTENIKDIKQKFEKDENIKNLNNYYQYNEIINFDKIKDCLRNEIIPKKWIEVDDSKFTFEYIDSREKLVLPVYYKVLIDKASSNRNTLEKYTESLFAKYSKENKKIKELSDNIKTMHNIPIEILCKYFLRLYSIESDFYRDINKDLRADHIEYNLPFIQTIYEGLNLEALPLASDKTLYRGSTISKDEVKQIEKNIKEKRKDLPDFPGALAFCKSFLSFSKDKKIAEQFPFNMKDIKKDYFKVLYILEKDDKIEYNLLTHCDLENISDNNREKEVLFFPFSSFGIKSIDFIEKENRYVINLVYLGKFLKDYKISKENKLINSELKKKLASSGLVDPKKLENETNKKLEKEFKNEAIEIKKKIKQKHKQKPKPKSDKNIITAEIEIKEDENINKHIQIINSYENTITINKKQFKNINKPEEFKNENDIRNNIEIKINNKTIPLFYLHKFEKAGKYEIKYIFKKKLTRINHMFYECNDLKNIDFSEFNTEQVTNMSYMFYGCKSLNSLDLSYFSTENVAYIKNMFEGCSNMKSIDLSNFDTSCTADMNSLFKDCNKLSTLDLSNFKTKNVTDMQYMFQNCQSLSNLNMTFDTSNVADMSSMFDGCSQLKSLDISHFNVKKVTKMNYMFQNCKSLIVLKLPEIKTEHLTEVMGIFKGCEALSSINLSNLQTNNITNMSCMFQNCTNLTDLDLSIFDTKNVSNMECMFQSCVNLRYLNLMNFDDTSLACTNHMFNGCNSLEKENIQIKDGNKILNEIISKY